jgi:flagellar hook-associated protein 2
MPVQLTGLGGFDSSGVISQLVAIAKKPVEALAARKQQVDSASTTMGQFSSRIGTFKINANSLADASGYSSYAVTSTDASVVASANGSALAGSYDIAVTQLATAQKIRGDAQTSGSAALGFTGTLSIQVGTNTAVGVTVTATDTLGDIATKISASGAKVSASVLFDGTDYRLAVQGLDSGVANAFTISQSGFDLGLSNPANVKQTALDAKFTVDGLPITRSTNQITGVIPGVTLALTKTGVSSTVRVASDTTALKQKLQFFVSSYNDLVNASHTATGYSGTKATNPVLAGEPAMRRSVDTLARLVSSAVPGATGAFTSLGSVGLTLSANGTLSLDSTKFDAAVAKDSDGVRRLFITDTALGATGIMKTLATTADGFVNGTTSPIKARIEALATLSKNIDDSANKKLDAVDAYEQQLKKQFAALDIAMSKYNTMSAAISGIGSGSNSK